MRHHADQSFLDNALAQLDREQHANERSLAGFRHENYDVVRKAEEMSARTEHQITVRRNTRTMEMEDRRHAAATRRLDKLEQILRQNLLKKTFWSSIFFKNHYFFVSLGWRIWKNG
jgi:hypothetical protein